MGGKFTTILNDSVGIVDVNSQIVIQLYSCHSCKPTPKSYKLMYNLRSSLSAQWVVHWISSCCYKDRSFTCICKKYLINIDLCLVQGFGVVEEFMIHDIILSSTWYQG